MKTVIGVETGGTKLQFALGYDDGTILFRHRMQVGETKNSRAILAAVEEGIPTVMRKAEEMGLSVERIGWGFGGPVITDQGIAIGNPFVSGWSMFPLSKYIEERYGIPTSVFNDTNAAAWGEYCCGAGRGTDVFFYSNIGTGIGGGIIIDGKLYDGQGRGAAEVGQQWIGDPWGGNAYGSERLENVCSGTAMEKRLHTLPIPSDSLLMQLCDGDQRKLDCRMLGQAVVQNDAFAVDFFDRMMQILAMGLANVVSFYSPQKLAIGGGVSLIGEPVISRLRKYIQPYTFINSTGTYEVVLNELGEDVVLVGAMLLAGAQNKRGG